MRVMAVVAWVLSSSSAWGAVDAAVVGKWQANLFGIPVNMDVKADGRCEIAEAPGKCSTKGSLLTFKGDGGSVTYQWSVAGNTLTMSGGDMQMPMAFQRQGGGKPASPSGNAPPSLNAAAEKGTRGTINKEGWGVTLMLPGGWKSTEKDGVILAGSDTEAGLILIRYVPKTTLDEMKAAYRAGINEQGFVAHPVGEATAFDAKGGTGLAGVLEGQGQDGNTIRVRSVGVLSKYGSTVVVVGLTTAAMYATLAARVDATAKSISFRAPPKSAPIAGNYEFVYVSPSGGYSRESKITLCQSGRFTKSGEMAGSGAAGSAVTSRSNGGTWRASGDGNGGTITLLWDDGATSTLPYQVSQNPKDRSYYGAGMRIGNTLYQKTGNGGC